MSKYSIKDLEQLSGIKAHTLRIWEQRYNFIKPKRTQTNIRFYDEKDLKLILNVSLLKENGHKISQISEMCESSMQEAVQKITDTSFNFPEQIHALTLAMIDCDEERFDKVLSSNILQHGFEKTMMNLVYPFMNKVGIMWLTGTISASQEHFISNLIRQKLLVAIDAIYQPTGLQKGKFLLFLPENELHELTLLFSYFLIKSRNYKVIYLGQSLPFEEILDLYEKHKPEYILTVFTTQPHHFEIQEVIDNMSSSFNYSRVIVSGRMVIGQDLNIPSNVLLLNNIPDLIEMLENPV